MTLGMRASDRRIIIGLGVTRRDRRRLRPGKAVLLPGRQLAVPMHDGGSGRLVHQIDAKAVAGRERDARFFVRPDEAEYSGRFAVDGEGSGAGSQAKRSAAGFCRGKSSLFCEQGDRAGNDNAAKDLPAG